MVVRSRENKVAEDVFYEERLVRSVATAEGLVEVNVRGSYGPIWYTLSLHNVVPESLSECPQCKVTSMNYTVYQSISFIKIYLYERDAKKKKLHVGTARVR